MNDKFLKTQALYNLIDFEPFVIMMALVLFAWLFYKIFLRDVSDERHRNLRIHFRNLLRHAVWFAVLFFLFKFSQQTESLDWPVARTQPYLGLLTAFWGMVVFVKTARLVILQYLFLGSMKTGVPVLIVNIFSLIMTVSMLLWGANNLFGLQLGPLLATSAAFSIILGLALQDTLGNLFAGISLQLDRSFDIGDWLEVTNGPQKIIGEVKEITWRATTLTGWSDEIITIPNRTMANSQLSNFQGGDVPIIRSQIFRLPLDVDIDLAKQCLKDCLQEVHTVRKDLPPVVFISDTSDSWLLVKLVYHIDSYGSQFRIGDQVLIAGFGYLRANGIEPATQTIRVRHDSETASPLPK